MMTGAGTAENNSFRDFLQGLGGRYLEYDAILKGLGSDSTADLKYAKPSDLKEAGIPIIHARRLITEATVDADGRRRECE